MILITCSFFYPHIGGLERNNWQIARRLAKKDEVVVLTFNTENSSRYENLDGFKIVRLDCWNVAGKYYPIPKSTIKNFKDVLGLFREHPKAVITNTRFYLLTFFSAILAKFYKIKHIHIERGANHTIHPSKIISFIAKFYDLTFGRAALRLADVIGGQSQAALDFVKSLGIKNKPMFVAYNGVDLEKFKTTSYNFKRILFVGRLIADKGAQDLIIAFKNIEQDFSGLELLIAGDGPFRKDLEKLAKGSNVKFLGHLEYPEIAKVYEKCAVYVSLSYSNGLSTTILEAGAAGLVVLASDQSGVRELINKDRGFLFELRNIRDLTKKLRFILKQKPKEKGKNLQKYIHKNFNWDNLVENLEKQI